MPAKGKDGLVNQTYEDTGLRAGPVGTPRLADPARNGAARGLAAAASCRRLLLAGASITANVRLIICALTFAVSPVAWEAPSLRPPVPDKSVRLPVMVLTPDRVPPNEIPRPEQGALPT